MKNPIYIHDAALISPLGASGFKSSKSYFCTQNGTLVGKIDDSSEKQLQLLKEENSQYHKLDRSTLLAILVARRLKLDTKDVAINIGSSRGATGIWEDFHEEFLKTGTVPVQTSPLTTLGNVSSWVAQDLGTESTAFSHSITCATAAHSVLNAIAWLESGMATTFIAGGTEAPLTDFTIAQMKALRIYSQEKEGYQCRALDLEKTRNTMILGEAAAAFVLSKESSKSGIKISGYGTAMESLKSATSVSSDGLGFQKSMHDAMGNNSADSIDAIITHAPGTIQGDSSEVSAIKEYFGNAYPRLCNNKWQIGHSLGASAAVNLYMAIDLLKYGKFHSIPYLDDSFVNPRGDERQANRILINASGFGGNCVSILVEKE
ncbi:beta-ketoacyl synthase N-terminal-like domain-containing protein [Nonlabens antarcticus]|uniref:beta-ketoacyl synthase N-terminal-like domain-containing protein n=1 Tax=Nonlabens antarcticus TaxID=392714 RepID=UPI001890E574|nr:beta-ketoacyl synthase N-terminal-like domain-containing protein [Nonlabens antarcticus]